ncbi:regulatory iron-sulfur-containing complex subunit RicT [Desulfonatronospira sp.]|uniref:PSP1 domain-containing protein n=1 Tax=Desulfonatronospira sp. TaxID=1962951 RepID=UPI003443D1C2
MAHIAGVKFRDQGQIYFFQASPFVVQPGDAVMVKTQEGLGLASVVQVKDTLPEGFVLEDLKPIFRLANEEDFKVQEENRELGREAFAYCRKCLAEHNLDMKLVDVEVFFDRSKIVFYFTAPGRVDFRDLVKELVKVYRTRIELRQIGVRHETQMVGALGNCGQVCCCRRFMRQFAPVTIKMAKDQNLFLNPAKISGVCGRLLCCLNFEQPHYAQFQKKLPKMGKRYKCRDGYLRVIRANLFRESLTVMDEEGTEKEIPLQDWTQMLHKPDKKKENK